jgi:ssRNA-specific RNase YbeY (16S rRNA maturation enzyme)
MKLIRLSWLVLSFILIQDAIAGHGRDGGWPQSIQLLRFSKQHLIELVKQATDQDIQDAIDNMHDRDEAIRPQEVDKKVLTRLIESIVDPDVEQIEKSKYTGVRLFYYDDSKAPQYKIYATKNFFNLQKYQVGANEINASLVKEVQTLLLHEVSHLWGFGEENGDINYARTFATKMVEILHGNFKKNYDLKEKMSSLSQAFFHEAGSLQKNNQEFKLKNKLYQCLTISDLGESKSEILFSSTDVIWSGIDGHSLRSNENLLIRGTMDDYLIIEEYGKSPLKIMSRYSGTGWFQKSVKSYIVCHPQAEKIDVIVDRFVTSYYTRSNLMTDLNYSSTIMFQFVIGDKLQSAIDNFKQTNSIQSKNQDQIIYNIDVKIKKQMQKDYEWLTSRRYKYSKDKDSAVLAKFNSVINSDVSSQAQSFYAQAGNTLKALAQEIDRMENISRRNMMVELVKDFFKEFNAIADMTKKHQDDNQFSNMGCYKEKRIGKFYACYLEDGKTQALSRKQLYVRMDQALDLLMKKTSTRLQKIQ